MLQWAGGTLAIATAAKADAGAIALVAAEAAPSVGAFPEEKEALERRIASVLASNIPEDRDFAGLGTDAKALGDVINERRKLLEQLEAAAEKLKADRAAGNKDAVKADREKLKADREKLKADRAKLKADREKRKSERAAAKAAKAGPAK